MESSIPIDNIVTSVDQIRTIDNYSINHLKIPGIVLMDQAGFQASRYIVTEYPLKFNQKVLVVCGSGNNGGDGYVVARYLHTNGYRVHVAMTKNKASLKGDALLAFQSIEHIEGIKKSFDINRLPPIKGLSIIVDAILGTGFQGTLDEKVSQIIADINQNQTPVISLDIPSGISGDSCEEPESYIKSNHTLSFGFAKTSQVLEHTKHLMGTLKIIDIGYPKEALKSIQIDKSLINPSTLPLKKLKRIASSHKGSYGKLLVIGGCDGMSGAPIISAWAALKAGAGIVHAVLPRSNHTDQVNYPAEVMLHRLPTNNNHFTIKDLDIVLKFIKEKGINSLCVGMGMGSHPETTEFVYELLKSITLPTVLDADGLRVLSRHDSFPHQSCIVTPHPKEFIDYFHSTPLVQTLDPIQCLKTLAKKHHIHLVHKSSTTLIATPNEKVYINTSGNPYMASAGMGDCLSGIIGAFLAQGFSLTEAANLGVYMHGKSGDDLQNKHLIACTASEVADHLSSVIMQLTCS